MAVLRTVLVVVALAGCRTKPAHDDLPRASIPSVDAGVADGPIAVAR